MNLTVGDLMSYRIPIALGWLVRRRARLDGLIQSIESEIHRISKLQLKLNVLKEDLKALDRTIGLHEVPIDATLIPTVKAYDSARFTLRSVFKRGYLSRALQKKLRESQDEYVSTTELTQCVLDLLAAEHPNIPVEAFQYLRIRGLVRYRLKGLRNAGRIDCRAGSTGCHERWWRLVR